MKYFTKTLNKLSVNSVGNALKYTNLEEAKKMCQLLNNNLAPDAALRHYRHVYEKDGVYYVMETGEAVSKGMKRAKNSKVGNAIPQGQVDGPSGAEIREIAGKVYKTGMPKDRLILETCWELAKKYKNFQTNTHTSDMVSEVIEKYKIGNSKRIDFAKHIVGNSNITLWKGSDSVYIKENGEVSYLENNSFETDRDKFNSQQEAISQLKKQGYK